MIFSALLSGLYFASQVALESHTKLISAKNKTNSNYIGSRVRPMRIII